MNRARNRSQSRSFGTSTVLGVLMMAGAACAEVTPTDPTPVRAAIGSFAKVSQTLICHATGTGNYLLLAINEHAVAAHRSHGDALPGEPVPGMAGHQFDADCVPKSIATNLTGEWAGTYTWDCGGARTGSAAIRFVLTDLGTGRITGTVSYLGGSSALSEGDRLVNPIFRADGTLLSGDLDPDGMYVRLRTNGDATFFVNNEFVGVIAPDFNSITGNTMNGDSATPGSNGCSAAVGYSGTFVVTRVN